MLVGRAAGDARMVYGSGTLIPAVDERNFENATDAKASTHPTR